MEQEMIFRGVGKTILKTKFYFGSNVGGNGTSPNLRSCWYQNIRGSTSGSKVSAVRILRMQRQALGDYELAYSVPRLGFYSVEWGCGSVQETSPGCTQVSRQRQSWMVGLDFHTGGVGIRISPGQLAANFWDEIPRTFGQSLFINMIALSLLRRPSGVVLFKHQHSH